MGGYYQREVEDTSLFSCHEFGKLRSVPIQVEAAISEFFALSSVSIGITPLR
jgi:hypothetical protein